MANSNADHPDGHYEHRVSFPDGSSKKIDVCEYDYGINDVVVQYDPGPAGGGAPPGPTTGTGPKGEKVIKVPGKLTRYYHKNWAGDHHTLEDFHTIYDYVSKKTVRIDTLLEKDPDTGQYHDTFTDITEVALRTAESSEETCAAATPAELASSGVVDVRDFAVAAANTETVYGPDEFVAGISWQAANRSLIVNLKARHRAVDVPLAIPASLFGPQTSSLEVRVGTATAAAVQKRSGGFFLLDVPVGIAARSLRLSANAG
jgi:hypothetical protein